MTHWFAGIIPQRVLFDFGFFQVYWYSLLLVAGITAAYTAARSRYVKVYGNEKMLADAAFYAIIAGIVGARLWHVFIFQWEYYAAHPAEIFQIWQGGIAIQGGLIAGFAALWWFAKKHKVNSYELLDYGALAVPLGQAIGRWGNFFNQELYGRPTDMPWGIFIEPENRVAGYETFSYFHPAFFYESVLNFLLFFIIWNMSKKKQTPGYLTAVYLLGYGIIRFLVDFVRIDPMPMVYGLRLSQVISVVFFIGASIVLYQRTMKKSF